MTKYKPRSDSMSSYYAQLFDTTGRPRVIVCGSRDWKDKDLLFRKLTIMTKNLHNPIICTGAAPGADRLAEEWAFSRSYTVWRFHAEWEKHGKSAGMIRNRDMAKKACERMPAYCIAFWKNRSPGTRDMIQTAKKFGMKLRIVEVE